MAEDKKEERIDAVGKDYWSIRLQRDMLHTKMGGGLPKSSLILVEGKDGYGKSIIAQRLGYAFMENGASLTYISTELSTKDFLEQMNSLKYVVDKYLIDQKLLFIPMFPYFGAVKLKEDFMERLLAAEKLFDTDIIIIDTISFLLVKANLSEARAFDVLNFFKKITNKGKIVMFTVDPDQLNKSLLTLLRSTSDIYIELGSKIMAGEIKKFMAINRFKRSEGLVSQTISFKVDPGQGLIIDIAGLV